MPYKLTKNFKVFFLSALNFAKDILRKYDENLDSLEIPLKGYEVFDEEEQFKTKKGFE
jgi:hypothetical protein